MAAIGKIRSWGPWLVGIIGLALFGFIATDFTRSCETSSNQARQQVGEVMGTKLSIQDYQSKIEELKNVLKFLGQDGNEDFLREYAWSDYVRNAIVQAEAKKLGLGVTEEEKKNVLQQGTHPVLRNLPLMREFFNQQTGQFDYNNVQQIYNMLQQQSPDQFQEFERYWKTVENMLGEQREDEGYAQDLAITHAEPVGRSHEGEGRQHDGHRELRIKLELSGIGKADAHSAASVKVKPVLDRGNEEKDGENGENDFLDFCL